MLVCFLFICNLFTENKSDKVRRQILGTQRRLDIFSPFRSQSPKGGWMSSLPCSAGTSIYRSVGLMGRQTNYGSPETHSKMCSAIFLLCSGSSPDSECLDLLGKLHLAGSTSPGCYSHAPPGPGALRPGALRPVPPTECPVLSLFPGNS